MIPGFRSFTVVLGVNPINQQPVPRSTAELLRAVAELLPAGGLLTRALDTYGLIDRAGAWIDSRLATLGLSAATIEAALDRFVSTLEARDLLHPGGVWNRARAILAEPAGRVVLFARSLAGAIVDLIKDAALRPLAELAARQPGWDLLCAVLGKNPLTGAAVPRAAETVLGGFLRLIGQQELWDNIQKASAVPRAWAWFQAAVDRGLGFVREVPALLTAALQALTVEDLAVFPQAFAKVARAFGDFAGRFATWAAGTVWDLLELIFSVVTPGALVYLRRAGAAFRTILGNPVGFLRNLIAAGRQGFTQFAGNAARHLQTALIGWLTGTLGRAGLYLPRSLALPEIGRLVLSVLGISWPNIRTKLVKAVGEPAVKALETGFNVVTTLVRGGTAAAWDLIQQSLADLRDTVLQSIVGFVRDRVITAAVTRLLALLTPAGAFLQAILGIYDTVRFFVERLQQIAQVGAAIIDSIASIANGVIAAAANKVEQTLANLLTLVTGYLARIAGLGNLGASVGALIKRLQARVDRAIDAAILRIVELAQRAGRAIAQVGTPKDPKERLRVGLRTAAAAVNTLSGSAPTATLIEPVLAAVRIRYGFQSLRPVVRNGVWWVEGRINPEGAEKTEKKAKPDSADGQRSGALTFTSVSFSPGGSGETTAHPVGDSLLVQTAEYRSSGRVQVNGGTDVEARDWEIGYLQLVRSTSRKGHYVGSPTQKTYAIVLPANSRDAVEGSEPPWVISQSPYKKRFTKTSSTEEVIHQDAPFNRFPWNTPDKKGRLAYVDGKDMLVTWIVARKRSAPNEIRFIHWETWEANFDVTTKFASRGIQDVDKENGITRNIRSGRGQGEYSPNLTGTPANKLVKREWRPGGSNDGGAPPTGSGQPTPASGTLQPPSTASPGGTLSGTIDRISPIPGESIVRAAGGTTPPPAKGSAKTSNPSPTPGPESKLKITATITPSRTVEESLTKADWDNDPGTRGGMVNAFEIAPNSRWIVQGDTCKITATLICKYRWGTDGGHRKNISFAQDEEVNTSVHPESGKKRWQTIADDFTPSPAPPHKSPEKYYWSKYLTECH
ncbi:MAG TPA: hypothetical protein VMS11_13195, partial [Solirubrobacterales bacterium]|nr:hypothetical protein [Solirubrobacterales bacterium]